MKSIVAAVVSKPTERFEVKELSLDDPREGEVLVRIEACGICHTDLVARDREAPISFPAVLGHEGGGVVVKVGSSDSAVRPGDRVALSFSSCGKCLQCCDGHPAYCNDLVALNLTGMRQDGTRALHCGQQVVSSHYFGQSSFATFALTRERNVVPIGDTPFDIAAPLGCGIQTGFGAVTRVLNCDPRSRVLIIGAGAVGLSAVMAAAIRGCEEIIVVEPQEKRRALALELGATAALDPSESDDLARLIKGVSRHGISDIVDTSGRVAAINGAMQAIVPLGSVALVGIVEDTTVPLDTATIVLKGLVIRGVIEGDADPQILIPELIEHWRAGRLPIEKMIETFSLSKIEDAIEAQRRGSCVKAVLKPWD